MEELNAVISASERTKERGVVIKLHDEQWQYSCQFNMLKRNAVTYCARRTIRDVGI